MLWLAKKDELQVYDLQNHQTKTVVEAENLYWHDFNIGYEDGEALRELDSTEFLLAIQLNLEAEPSVETFLGCDNVGYDDNPCYKTDGSSESLQLTSEMASEKAGLEAARLPDVGYLKRLALRAKGNAKLVHRLGEVKELVAEVPDRCEEGGCGDGRRITNRYWKVVVANSWGDLFHHYEQIYDGAAKEFVHADTGARSSAPHPDGEIMHSVSGEFMTPDGRFLLGSKFVLNLENGKKMLFAGTPCGWEGGGIRL